MIIKQNLVIFLIKCCNVLNLTVYKDLHLLQHKSDLMHCNQIYGHSNDIFV